MPPLLASRKAHGARPRRVARNMLKTLLISAACGWLALAAYVYFWQARLVFHPARGLSTDPGELGYAWEDVTLHTADGVRIHGWHITRAEPRFTVLFFHGNAGTIADRPLTIARLHELGANVFMIDYRGYGNSEGSPDETGTYADAGAAWTYLTDSLGVAPGDIVIYGRSLGGAVALELASRVTPRALIVESTFSSLADMAREHYPYLPTRLLLRFEYPNLEHIRRVRAPILVAHSDADALIPIAQAERLFAAAPSPKQFYRLRGDHNEAFVRAGAPYYTALGEFITGAAQLTPAPRSTTMPVQAVDNHQ